MQSFASRQTLNELFDRWFDKRKTSTIKKYNIIKNTTCIRPKRINYRSAADTAPGVANRLRFTTPGIEAE
jgi:hypothetical protein